MGRLRVEVFLLLVLALLICIALWRVLGWALKIDSLPRVDQKRVDKIWERIVEQLKDEEQK